MELVLAHVWIVRGVLLTNGAKNRKNEKSDE